MAKIKHNMKTIRIEEMNWMDIQKAIEDGFTTVVVGIGSTEQHGPYLPIKTDALIGDVIANSFAQKWGRALQAPTICVGCSEHHMSFSGTISLKKTTLKALVMDYIESLVQHGFKTVILLPSHGGNFHVVRELIEEYKKKKTAAKVVGIFEIIKFTKVLANLGEKFNITQTEAGAHAGDIETSTMLFLASKLVKNDRFQTGYLGPFGEKECETIKTKGINGLSNIGVIGDPRKATAKKGKVYLEEVVNFCITEIRNALLNRKILL